MGWYNSDGLYVTFGTEEAQAGKAGMYRMAGPQQMCELTLDTLTGLTTTGVIQDYNTVLPKNARIEKVEVITTTDVTSGGSATLDIGLIRTDTTTAYDDDGLVAALALASFNSAGETASLTVGVTSAGALIGTTLANNGYLVASYNTAAITAGAIKVRIYYTRV